eukprot:m.232248 g.232248  ORF g.232248 m.232248 type:complete len:234 (+) comp17075_c1_seq1:85-786(+)
MGQTFVKFIKQVISKITEYWNSFVCRPRCVPEQPVHSNTRRTNDNTQSGNGNTDSDHEDGKNNDLSTPLSHASLLQPITETSFPTEQSPPSTPTAEDSFDQLSVTSTASSSYSGSEYDFPIIPGDQQPTQEVDRLVADAANIPFPQQYFADWKEADPSAAEFFGVLMADPKTLAKNDVMWHSVRHTFLLLNATYTNQNLTRPLECMQHVARYILTSMNAHRNENTAAFALPFL